MIILFLFVSNKRPSYKVKSKSFMLLVARKTISTHLVVYVISGCTYVQLLIFKWHDLICDINKVF